MWTLQSSKTRALTRQLAETFMKMEPAPQDRPLSERRLRVYRQSIQEGEWRPCIWAQAVCEETQITYRVNGKHTSTVFAGLETIPPDLFVTVETYVCPTLSDVARLYGTFDGSISTRTTRDINRAFAATVPEFSEIPARTIDACASGLQLYKSGGIVSNASQVRPTVRAENLLEESAFVLWAHGILFDGAGKHRHLTRSGVVAAMFACYKKSQKDATVFWQAVRDETGPSPHNPDRILSRWLLTTSAHAGTGGTLPRSRRADSREFYVKSLHCWNSWRRNETLKTIKYYPDAKVPVVA